MIQSINEDLCIQCGLCENLCQTDVFRRKDEKVFIAYPGDCVDCMACLFSCPTDAIVLTPGVPDKANVVLRWKRTKEVLTKGQ